MLLVGEECFLPEGDGAGVLHGTGGEIGHPDEIEFAERILDAGPLVVEPDLLLGGFEREARERTLVRGRTDAQRDAVGRAIAAHKVADEQGHEVPDIFWVRAKATVCLPASGPGVSDISAPFEMAVSPASIVIEMSKVAL